MTIKLDIQKGTTIEEIIAQLKEIEKIKKNATVKRITDKTKITQKGWVNQRDGVVPPKRKKIGTTLIF